MTQPIDSSQRRPTFDPSEPLAQGGPNGGVHRGTWLYNESTRVWADIAPRGTRAVSAPVFSLTGSGPYGEILDGLYRFRRALLPTHKVNP